MNLADKWFKKSLDSFDSDNEYQGIKQFNMALVRLVEGNRFEALAGYFEKIVPLLDSKKLYHEIDQIVNKYLSHVKKKQQLISGLKPLFNSLTRFISEDAYSLTSFHGMASLITFISHHRSDSEVIEFITQNFSELIDKSVNFSYFEQLLFQIFHLFVLYSKLDIALDIADPTFFNSIENNEQLAYGMYAVLVIAIQTGLKTSMEKLQYFRKTVAKDLQESEMFKCCSEFILVSSSKDQEWLSELQTHFSNLIKENELLRILIGQLLKKYFPELKKSSIFDLFKLL